MSRIDAQTKVHLDDELIQDLRRLNPWWEGLPMPILPKTRRHLVEQIKRRFEAGLAPVVALRGPRQIGKTTAQLHVLQDLLGAGVPPRHIFRIQCDELPGLFALREPLLRMVDWYESHVLGRTLNEVARDGGGTWLFFDEVQNLNDWASQLKFLVDTSTTQALITGSSALRIELGRDSLAGRITTIESGTLSLTEIAMFHNISIGAPFLPDNGINVMAQKDFWRELAARGTAVADKRDVAFSLFSTSGGYPIAHKRHTVPWPALADQLNETIIKRVINHDLRIGERGRKRDAVLLEEIFRLACRYIGQSPAPSALAREAQRALQTPISEQRAAGYLRFLGETLLLRLIEPLEARLRRKRGHAKICLADHGLRASWLQEVVPLAPADLEENPHLSDMAGHIAESVAGATLSAISGLDVAHAPERAGMPECDFVITIGTKRIPMEIKYQRRMDPLRDTEGLRSFVEKSVNNAPFAVLITREDNCTVEDPRIITLPLSTLMLLR